MKANNLSNLLSPAAMAQLADNTGAYKVNKHPRITYLSAITAGIFISIAFVFILLSPRALLVFLSDWLNLLAVSVFIRTYAGDCLWR